MQNYVLEVFKYKSSEKKGYLLDIFNFSSEIPFSINIGRKDFGGIEEVVFLQEKSTLFIKDPAISHIHSIVNFNNDGSIYYQDKNSTNGSYLLNKLDGSFIVERKINSVSGRDLYILLGKETFLHLKNLEINKGDTKKIENIEDLSHERNLDFIQNKKRRIVIKRQK